VGITKRALTSGADKDLEISLYNEFKRKATHFFALSIPIGYYFLPKTPSLLIFAPFVLGSILMDVIRLRKLPLHGILNRLLGPILREHESQDFAGSSYILSASFLCILLFDKKAAVAAIAFIILGDIAAAMMGRKFGRTKLPLFYSKGRLNRNSQKSLEGSLSCLVVCFVVAAAVPHLPFWIGIVGAVVATIVEGANLPVDDNFSVPLVSGLTMHLLLRF
jgi:dolichol kinase